MTTITYDDRDPIIQYSTGWLPSTNDQDVNGTSTFTAANGATATITFTGVQISVFGTIPIVLPKTMSAYSIDGGPPTVFTASFQPDGNGDPNTYIFRQLYYQSPQLTPRAPHTLSIVLSQAVNASTKFYLDSVQVVRGDPSLSPLSLTSGTLLATSSGPSSTSDVPSSPTPPSGINASKSPPIGLVLGLTIGDVSLILLGVGVYLIWKQMRRRKCPRYPVPVVPSVHPFPLQYETAEVIQ